MKKIVCILLASLLLFSVALAAEPVDLSTYTDAELEALRLQVAEEIRARAMASAEASPVSDFRYVSNGKEIRINAYYGTGGVLSIPDEIDGVPVTQIYDNAFEKTWITSLRLPAGLVNIGSNAFFAADPLKHVLVMPTTLRSIKNSAFQFCHIPGLVLQSDCVLSQRAFAYGELEFCYIREGSAVELGHCVFEDDPLETIVIPADVTKIDREAFHGCSNLTVYCPAGSYAEYFCQQNFIACDTANYEAMVAYYEALYPAE